MTQLLEDWIVIKKTVTYNYSAAFCRGLKIQMSHTKSSWCGGPFVVYEFAGERILNKYAVISPDKQNNDRKVSDCLSLTRTLFVLLTTLKQVIHLKWPLNILTHASQLTFTYAITNKTVLNLFIFCQRWSPYFPAKKQQRTWSERLRLLLQSFLKL